MRIFKIKLLLVTFSLCFTFCFAEVKDATRESGRTGTAVVESCISQIYKSRIFAEDYNFLRRLAYADTTDGTALEQGATGGIWKVDSETITQIANSSYDVSSYFPAINAYFSINWTEVMHGNMSIPLYSALARRLHLAHLESTISEIPSVVLTQGLWRAIYVHAGDDGVVAENYVTAIEPILTGCSQPKRDVVFLVDSSHLETYLEESKTVINNVITQLKIDSNLNKTVVGISQYSTEVLTSSYLNGSASESDVLAVLSGLQTISGSRLTATAIRSVISNFFNVANGAKGWASGTPQILCVFVTGSSFDSVTYIAENASQSAVTIMAIGISEEITNEELNITASDPNVDHAFHIGNYTSNTALAYAITRQICAETALVPSSEKVISGSIDVNESLSLTLPVPSTGLDSEVSLSSGSMAIYYSASIEQPSSANYEFELLIQTTGQNVPFTYTPTARSSGNVVDLYVTLENTFEGTTHFTITISGDEAVTVNININSNSSNNATTETHHPSGAAKGLTEGEIAGIVFSCLIVICAVLVAVVYYRFGKPNVKPLFHRGSLDRPMDSRAQHKRLEASVRERLHSAVRRKDIPDISEAVEDFIALRLEDVTGDFVTAQGILAIQQCKQGITKAIHSKNIKLIEKAVLRGKRMEYDMELKMELMNAEILLQDLKKIDNLLRRLKRAMDASDLTAVESITAELRVLKGCDQAMIERMLTIYQFKEDLEEGMERRDIAAIKESIGRIEAKGFVQELASELKQANKLLRDLAMMEKARSDVMGLRQSSVSEIRSYATPPEGVHEIMTSVYLLLGYHPVQLEVWTSIQALMGKTGRESLRRMIGGMNITSVDVMKARMAKSLLTNFDLNAIREISEALSVFYIFAKTAIKEVEKFLPEGERDSMASWSDISTPLVIRR